MTKRQIWHTPFGQWFRRVLIEPEPMDETVDSRDVQALKNWAKATACVRLVWIFGSRVRGEGHHNSDLDVAVEIDPVGRDELAQPGWIELSPGWRAELGKVLTAPLDLEWVGEEGAHFSKMDDYLSRSSLLIYKRPDL